MRSQVSLLSICFIGAGVIALASPPRVRTYSRKPQEGRGYLGFDRNIYPGDEAMKALRRDFVFSAYWLSPPPEEKFSTWRGKREFMRSLGYGFVVLYRGRLERELRNATRAETLGKADAEDAAQAAKREGFPADTIIFLDIEEGGRLSPAYHSYIADWLQLLKRNGYQGGFYCSGIPVKEDAQTTITTADDIAKFFAGESRTFSTWAFNDVCPPSPGCSFPEKPPSPALSGSSMADVWQYAQSPRINERTAHCAPGYHADGNCYAPGDTRHAWFLDVNSAGSPDPSKGR